MDLPNATCITMEQVSNTSGDSKLATTMSREINNINVAMGSALDTKGNSTYLGTNITGGTEQRMQSAVPIQAGLYRHSVWVLKDMAPAKHYYLLCTHGKAATEYE